MKRLFLCMLALVAMAAFAALSATGPPAEGAVSAYYIENAIGQPATTPVLDTFAILGGATSLDGGQPADLAVVEFRHSKGEQAREVVAILAPRVAGTYFRTMSATYTGIGGGDIDLRRIEPATLDTRHPLRC